ncbi:MAG TPA: hypothetical protein VIQ30_12245 [Pseudonocardia sp.]|jgi:hypothetical protein
MSRERAVGRTSGGIIAIGGGLINGLSYLLLPVATIPLVGSLSAPDVATAAPEATSLALLHIVPIAALVAVGVGLWLVVGKPAGRAQRIAAVALFACAAVTTLAYLWPFARLQQELSGSGVSSLGITATTFTGIGFWLAVIGAIVTAVAGVMELIGSRAAPVTSTTP